MKLELKNRPRGLPPFRVFYIGYKLKFPKKRPLAILQKVLRKIGFKKCKNYFVLMNRFAENDPSFSIKILYIPV